MVESTMYESYCGDYQVALENIIAALDKVDSADEKERIDVTRLHKMFKGRF